MNITCCWNPLCWSAGRSCTFVIFLVLGMHRCMSAQVAFRPTSDLCARCVCSQQYKYAYILCVVHRRLCAEVCFMTYTTCSWLNGRIFRSLGCGWIPHYHGWLAICSRYPQAVWSIWRSCSQLAHLWFIRAHQMVTLKCRKEALYITENKSYQRCTNKIALTPCPLVRREFIWL